MSLYTGKGDGGTTKLFTSQTGERHSKSDAIFEALGTVDELNTIIGWCKAGSGVNWMVGTTPITHILLSIQHHLFTIQAELAGADMELTAAAVEESENLIALIEDAIPPVTSFLVPGGTELSARLDIARTVARRAERRVVLVCEEGTDISEYTKTYLNRLSSVLYALVRYVNHKEGKEEQPPKYSA